MSTSSIKRQIKRFHFVVVHVKEMYLKTWCTCRAFFFIIKPIVFWSCRCRRRRRSCFKVMLHGTIRNDDVWRNTALQYWNNVAAIRNNVATMMQRCVVLKIVVVKHHLNLPINSPNENAANTIEPDTAAASYWRLAGTLGIRMTENIKI